MGRRYNLKKLRDYATTEQQVALLDLSGQRWTILGEIADMEAKHKEDKKAKTDALGAIDAQVMELLDAIESGQQGLPW